MSPSTHADMGHFIEKTMGTREISFMTLRRRFEDSDVGEGEATTVKKPIPTRSRSTQRREQSGKQDKRESNGHDSSSESVDAGPSVKPRTRQQPESRSVSTSSNQSVASRTRSRGDITPEKRNTRSRTTSDSSTRSSASATIKLQRKLAKKTKRK